MVPTGSVEIRNGSISHRFSLERKRDAVSGFTASFLFKVLFGANSLCGVWFCLSQDETAEHTSTYELISQRKIPTLVIHGANDAIVPVSTGRKVAACISSATFHEIPECGHLPHEEYPQKFVEIVAAFLQNLDDV